MRLHEDKEGNVVMDNLQEIAVCKPEDILSLMQVGEENRHYGVTDMNERSSRSHTIFR